MHGGLRESDIGTKICYYDQENIKVTLEVLRKSESDIKRAQEDTCAMCMWLEFISR